MPGEGVRRSRGFTLIELIVVLAIIGIVVGVTVPLGFKRVPGAAITAAAGEIRAALRGARATAIAEGRRIVFRGDPAGGYWLDRRYHPLAATAQGVGALGVGALRVAIAGAAHIDFFPSGRSSGGRILVDGTAGRREIAVDAITGRAVVVR